MTEFSEQKSAKSSTWASMLSRPLFSASERMNPICCGELEKATKRSSGYRLALARVRLPQPHLESRDSVK